MYHVQSVQKHLILDFIIKIYFTRNYHEIVLDYIVLATPVSTSLCLDAKAFKNKSCSVCSYLLLSLWCVLTCVLCIF